MCGRDSVWLRATICNDVRVCATVFDSVRMWPTVWDCGQLHVTVLDCPTVSDCFRPFLTVNYFWLVPTVSDCLYLIYLISDFGFICFSLFSTVFDRVWLVLAVQRVYQCARDVSLYPRCVYVCFVCLHAGCAHVRWVCVCGWSVCLCVCVGGGGPCVVTIWDCVWIYAPMCDSVRLCVSIYAFSPMCMLMCDCGHLWMIMCD